MNLDMTPEDIHKLNHYRTEIALLKQLIVRLEADIEKRHALIADYEQKVSALESRYVPAEDPAPKEAVGASSPEIPERFRVHEIAKAMGLSNADTVKIFQEAGAGVRSHLSYVTAEQITSAFPKGDDGTA